jgi:hypothetical protein
MSLATDDVADVAHELSVSSTFNLWVTSVKSSVAYQCDTLMNWCLLFVTEI